MAARAARHRPPNILYGVEDRPPLVVNVLSGLQHVGLMSVFLMYPALLAQAAGAPPDIGASLVSMTMIALAIGTLLQVIRMGPVGSGYLCQPISSVVYFVPSLLAVKQGGLTLVFGMTAAAGLLEVVLARGLGRLRALFPAEISGLVVLLVGITTGSVGLRTALDDVDLSSTANSHQLGLALATLALMVALNVWGRGPVRMFCMLLGMAGGYVAAWLLGAIGDSEWERVAAAPAIALPALGHLGLSFDATLAIPFAIAAVAASLKAMGNVTTCQKLNDADWVRPDMRSIGRGVAADGLGSLISGLLGGHGLNSSTPVVGLSNATGITSRSVAWPVAAILLGLAFVPRIGLVLSTMPKAVVGAALVFSSTFIIVNGIEIMTSRLLDVRKTLVIGTAIVFGLAVEMNPHLLRILPTAARAALGSSIVVGTLVGLLLNLLLRIGVRRTATIEVEPGAPGTAEALEEFIEAQGAAWGARRDVIERAGFNLAQSIETIASIGVVNGVLEVAASFDEFRLDLRVSYDGPLPELPDKRPTNEEIIASEEGERRLAGFMLRRLADRVSASQKGARSVIVFHFDH